MLASHRPALPAATLVGVNLTQQSFLPIRMTGGGAELSGRTGLDRSVSQPAQVWTLGGAWLLTPATPGFP